MPADEEISKYLHFLGCLGLLGELLGVLPYLKQK